MIIKKIKIGLFLTTAGIAAALWFVGCNRIDMGYHKYIMRGSVLAVNGKEVDICIGSRDGARVGQELDVYWIEGAVKHKSPSSVPEYKREKIGVIRIASIYDDHYAKAVIVSGKAVKNSVAEIEIRH